MAMPERIWAGSKAAVGAPNTGDWHPVETPSTPTEYVLATTHQRILATLREAEKALQFYTNRMTYVSRIGMDSPITKDNFGDIGRAALARIKEATDAG